MYKYFFIILIILILSICVGMFKFEEKFLICDRIPSGPYKTKCTNIKYNDGIIYALCPTKDPENIFISSKLDLKNCIKDQNDCNSININSDGNLICE